MNALLQAQFSQLRPVAMPPSLAPRMPIYPPGAPGIGQQLFYGQGPPALIPPQVIVVFIYIFSILHMIWILRCWANSCLEDCTRCI